MGYGHRRLGFTLCDPCHTIAPIKDKNSVFNTREEIHNHFDRQFKFRALAKNMAFTNEYNSTQPSMLLYTHYNREFSFGLIVKIPGSDNLSTKYSIFEESSFSYVMVTKVYPKKKVPEWANACAFSGETPFVSKSGRSFDYYVEVIPYELAKNACVTISRWWKRVNSK